MALTFSNYVGIHVACGIGLFIITGLILFLLMKYGHNIYKFLLGRVLSVELEYPNDKKSHVDCLIKIDGISVKSKYQSSQGFFLWLISTTTLTLALMILFEGCILGSAGVYLRDDCPSDPMTCFASSTKGSDKGIFECVPGNKTVFPGGTTNAWCYGWILKRQTVSAVINQIGICGGILGVSGTLFAFMFRLAGGESWQRSFFSILFTFSLLVIPIMILVANFSHIVFSVLAYLVAFEVIMLFYTVIAFRKNEKGENNTVSVPKPVEITCVSN